jgi:hypothetical protein
MTLVLALKWFLDTGEAVLVASDSKASTPFGIAYEVKKIYPIFYRDKPVGIASGAGDASLVKWGFEEAGRVLLTYAEKEYPVTFSSFSDAVRELEHRFVKRFAELRNQGLDMSFQMLLSGLDIEGKVSLYLFDNRGLAESVHDNPGYAVIGSGFVTGGILLLRLLGYRPDVQDLGLLTTFILDSVSEVDMTVGPFVGESYLLRIQAENSGKELILGPLKDEALVQYKENSRKRRELITKLWQLCDLAGEKEVEKLMNRLEKKSQQQAKKN